MSKRDWQYLKYVAKHKWFVAVASIRLGVPIWRVLLHDWTKFLPSEWRPYAEWFYGYNGGSWYALKKQFKEHPTWAGPYGLLISREAAFDRAWNLHQERNDHHWEFWLLSTDDGGTKILPMPDAARREMLADWMGAGRAITGRWEVVEWYAKNRHKMQLHPDTRTWIEAQLGVVEAVSA